MSIPSTLSNNKNRYTPSSYIGNIDEEKHFILRISVDWRCEYITNHQPHSASQVCGLYYLSDFKARQYVVQYLFKSWKNGQKVLVLPWKNGQNVLFLPWKNGQNANLCNV